MNVRLKRAKELAGYAVQLTKDEGLPTMVRRGAGFVKRRCFGKRARYLPAKKVLEAQRAEMAGKTAADCGLPTISVLTPLYNTPEKYLRELLDSFAGQTAPNGQLCLADASDAAHGDVERIVKEYQQKNQQIVYKKIENKGIAANTNAAAQLATGEYPGAGRPRRHSGTPCSVYHGQGHPAAAAARRTGRFSVQRRSAVHQEHPPPHGGALQAGLRPGLPAVLQLHLPSGRVPAGAVSSRWAGNAPNVMAVRTTTFSSGFIEQVGGAAHVPQVLYYWRVHEGSTSGGTDAKPYVAKAAKKALADHLERTGRTGTIEDGLYPSTYRVRWDIVGEPKVSILIPNKDHTEDLEKCLQSIWKKTTWDRFEVIVIENNSTDPATFCLLREGPAAVRWPEGGHLPGQGLQLLGHQQLLAGKRQRGDYLLLLNNDVEVVNGDWLTELLRQCAHPAVRRSAVPCSGTRMRPSSTQGS